MTCSCWKCGGVLERNAFQRGDRCSCGADTRCCRNCDFEEPGYRSECRETQAEPVSDREAANACDFFRPRQGPPRGERPAKDAGGKAAFDSLFKKKRPV
ncbi:MAG: hypothetical protein HY926_06335 [Elusimicrobia bacterium]|nr:hypothetical protein [Elusimicrobiota bacterium]